MYTRARTPTHPHTHTHTHTHIGRLDGQSRAPARRSAAALTDGSAVALGLVLVGLFCLIDGHYSNYDLRGCMHKNIPRRARIPGCRRQRRRIPCRSCQRPHTHTHTHTQHTHTTRTHTHTHTHTRHLPFQSYARDSPCSGAGSGPPCCGSCWTSRPSQTPIPSPFPRPRHSSSVANTYHSLCCRNFSAITLWEAKQRGHCYPRRRGLWTGKASSSSQELPSRSLASRAPPSTTVGHAPACAH